ncbi:hypothetical protein BY458DRAFT_479370 [Sporodiniella umbellata]|nr:hypothetical protein BY458DRAFT_479370 [Sporodiniella umbellata]
MFQFWSEWRRKGAMNSPSHKDENHDPMVRTCSNHSTPSNWSIDWSEPKRTLSFKEDYVSFPSVEPSHMDSDYAN